MKGLDLLIVVGSTQGVLFRRLSLLAAEMTRLGHRAVLFSPAVSHRWRWRDMRTLAGLLLEQKPDCVVCDLASASPVLPMALFFRVRTRVLWGAGEAGFPALLATSWADERAAIDPDKTVQAWAGWLERACAEPSAAPPER